MKRILIPTDFSPHAYAALSHAVLFAESFGAEVHLLNIQVPYGPTSPLVEEYPGEAEAKRVLDSLNTGSAPAVRAIRRGFAAGPVILDYASSHDIDLIVMGSHGYRGVPRLLLGSVAEEVLRASTCPVLVIREAEMSSPSYDHILVPVDFSTETDAQLEVATDLANRFGGSLDIIHVLDPPTVPELYVPVGPIATDMKTIAHTAYESLEEIAEPLRVRHEVTTEVLVGRAGKMIAKRARRADIIVMPTHGHSGVDRVLLGSVTEGVLRRVDCAVLALKRVVAPAEVETDSPPIPDPAIA
jgi:nucleotide-binding universal stress UspA family protein